MVRFWRNLDGLKEFWRNLWEENIVPDEKKRIKPGLRAREQGVGANMDTSIKTTWFMHIVLDFYPNKKLNVRFVSFATSSQLVIVEKEKTYYNQ